MYPSLIDPRLVNRNGELHPALTRLLKRFYGTVPTSLTLAELRAMTQPWVLARQMDPITGQAAERWGANPDARWRDIDLNDVLDDFRALGYVDAVYDLGGKTNFDAAIVPGGTAQPQWRRLSMLIGLWITAEVRFKELVFVTRRSFDERVDSLDKIWTPDGRIPRGCLPLVHDAKRPSDIPAQYTAKGGNIELYWMNLLWQIVQMPDELRAITPTFVDKPENYFEGRGKLDVLVQTVQPHMFHGPMYQRLAPAHSRVVTVAPSALAGRHDAPYLADGLARDIDQQHKAVLAQLNS